MLGAYCEVAIGIVRLLSIGDVIDRFCRMQPDGVLVWVSIISAQAR